MITNFEDITYDITDDEKRVAIYIERLLKSKNVFFNNKELSDMIIKASNGDKRYLFKDARIRKIINYLRLTTCPNIIATSKGYKISENVEELTKYLDSLLERIDAIQNIANSTNAYIRTIKNG